jgi:predicted NAD-dependent protein-ADP-ribosyltransferase YbiA (DUF1768 family)
MDKHLLAHKEKEGCSVNIARTKNCHITKYPTARYSAVKKPFIGDSDPAEDNLILLATDPKRAEELLKVEAEKLLEEGWEVMRVSKRSYIAVLDSCEIYLHTCSKGIEARMFYFDDSFS